MRVFKFLSKRFAAKYGDLKALSDPLLSVYFNWLIAYFPFTSNIRVILPPPDVKQNTERESCKRA